MADGPDPATQLARQLLAGLKALRSGDAQRAAETLSAVCNDRALSDSDELADVRARACSLYAQALLKSDRVPDATHWVEEAVRLSRRVGDPDGLREVEALRDQIRAAAPPAPDPVAAARSERLAATPIETLEERVRRPVGLVELLLAKANADLDAGRPHDALPIAERARNGAISMGDVRLEVMTRLTVARADPDNAQEELDAAHRAALAADEFNLVTAVARAATAHGMTVGVLRGPNDLP